MQPVELNYTITLSDFRKANSYALAQRNRLGFKLFLVVLAVALFCWITSVIGVFSLGTLPYFIALGYTVWMLILLGTQELRIRKYLRSPDCFLGPETHASFFDDMIRIRIPSKKIDVHFQIKNLNWVFELYDIYMLYVNEQNSYIIPKRGLSDMQKTSLRNNFSRQLGERFISRYSRQK